MTYHTCSRDIFDSLEHLGNWNFQLVFDIVDPFVYREKIILPKVNKDKKNLSLNLSKGATKKIVSF